jgi:hypothetical protein
MKVQSLAVAWGVLCALVTAGFIFGGLAGAAASGVGAASEVVKSLQAQGYNVMLNGAQFGPLTACAVTGVHNPDAFGRAMEFTTVYINISCPSNNT